MGLWGFSGSLTAIALGGMFIVMHSISAIIYTVIGTVFTVVLHGAVVAFFTPLGTPALTFPFCLGSWIFCLASKSIPILHPVEITYVTTPEDHLKSFNLTRKLKAKMKVAK